MLGTRFIRRRPKGWRFGLAAGLAAAGLIAPAALAQDHDAPPPPVAAPDFDVGTSCGTAPDPATCGRFEEEARGQLAALWPGLSPRKRARCEGRARSAGGSYVAALSCARSR